MGNFISARVRYAIILVAVVGIVRRKDVLILFQTYFGKYKALPPKTQELAEAGGQNKRNRSDPTEKKSYGEDKCCNSDDILEEAWIESVGLDQEGNSGSKVPVDLGEEVEKVKASFEKAKDYISAAQIQMTTEDQLNLYGLYKRATVGKCTLQAPGILAGMEKKYKYEAWKSKDSVATVEQAMGEYIQLVSRLSPNWNKKGGDSSETESEKNILTNENNVELKVPAKSKGVAAAMAKTQSTMQNVDYNPENEKINNDIFQFAQDGKLDLVKKALRNGCNVNNFSNLDSDKMTCLMWACDREQMDVVRYLVEEAGADLTLQDPYGQSALHYAVPYPEMAYYLAEQGADIELKDEDGYTPLELAKDTTCETDVDLLKLAYAKYRAREQH